MSSCVGSGNGLKVVFLTSGPTVPASRYRVFQYVPHLRKMGFQCIVANSFPEKYDYFPMLGWRCSRLLKRFVRRWHLFQMRFMRPDLVVLERELFDEPTDEFEQKLRRVAPRLLLDIDDGIFLRYPQKFENLLRLCDGIIAGNALLQDVCLARNPQVVVIPTCVDIDLYPARDSKTGSTGTTIVGWIGTPSNIPQLSLVLPALRAQSQQSALEFRIVSSQPDCLKSLDCSGINVRFIPWQAATAVEELRQFDIGIMPLENDNEWNQYKCGLKLIEYMAVGIPAIASSVGVNTEILTHGENGFLASEDADWRQHLAQLIADVSLRERIGAAARATIAARYSVQAALPLYAETLRKCAAGESIRVV